MPMTDAEMNKRAAMMAEILRHIYFGNPSKEAISRMLEIARRPRLVPDPDSEPEMSDREYKVVMKRVAEHFTDDELEVMGMDRWGRRVRPWPDD